MFLSKQKNPYHPYITRESFVRLWGEFTTQPHVWCGIPTGVPRRGKWNVFYYSLLLSIGVNFKDAGWTSTHCGRKVEIQRSWRSTMNQTRWMNETVMFPEVLIRERQQDTQIRGYNFASGTVWKRFWERSNTHERNKFCFPKNSHWTIFPECTFTTLTVPDTVLCPVDVTI